MKVKYVIITVIVALAVIFFYGRHLGIQRGENASNASISSLNTIISSYVVMIDDTKKYVAEKEQEVLTQREAIKAGDIERAELRKLNLKQANEISRLKLQIDTLLKDVNHNGQIVIVRDTVSVMPKNAILLPFTFGKQDEWLSFKGNFDAKGILDISLKKDLFLDIWSGKDRDTKKLKTVVSTQDPYIGVINIKSAKFDLEKPKKFGIGGSVGYAITRNGLSPYVGIGLNYSVIRF